MLWTEITITCLLDCFSWRWGHCAIWLADKQYKNLVSTLTPFFWVSSHDTSFGSNYFSNIVSPDVDADLRPWLLWIWGITVPKVRSLKLSSGYICDVLLALASQQLQNCFFTKVEGSCTCGQSPLMYILQDGNRCNIEKNCCVANANWNVALVAAVVGHVVEIALITKKPSAYICATPKRKGQILEFLKLSHSRFRLIILPPCKVWLPLIIAWWFLINFCPLHKQLITADISQVHTDHPKKVFHFQT